MRSCLIALSLLVLVGSSRAEAADNAVAIIWKGAKTQAEAEAQKPAWSGLDTMLGKAGMTFQDGHPKLVQSKTLPGLKPGFWVLLLGVCAPDDAPPIVEQIKLLSPESYSRKVKVPAKKLSCPQKEGAPLEAQDESLKRPAGATLRVFTREESESSVEEEGRWWDKSTRTRYHFVLLGKGGEVLGSDDAVGDEEVDRNDSSGPTAYRCDGTTLEASGDDTLVLTRHCGAGAGECGALMSADEVITVKVNENSVSASAAKRENAQYAECD